MIANEKFFVRCGVEGFISDALNHFTLKRSYFTQTDTERKAFMMLEANMWNIFLWISRQIRPTLIMMRLLKGVLLLFACLQYELCQRHLPLHSN